MAISGVARTVLEFYLSLSSSRKHGAPKQTYNLSQNRRKICNHPVTLKKFLFGFRTGRCLSLFKTILYILVTLPVLYFD